MVSEHGGGETGVCKAEGLQAIKGGAEGCTHMPK